LEFSEHPWCREKVFSSLFVGGGTPTIYSGEALAALIRQGLDSFSFINNPEVSVETNPNTVSEEKLGHLREAGVNRLSIGIQSFSDRLLRIIGRSHNKDEAVYAIQCARKVGFKNINFDFIYGLPQQGSGDLRKTLDGAIDQRPEHIALYEMTIEPGTAFAQMAEKVVIIGTDCPAITFEIIEEAFGKLTGTDLVLGPATDGGYYLVGLSKRAPYLFSGIEWGKKNVFQETRDKALAYKMNISILEQLSDIDRPEDLVELIL